MTVHSLFFYFFSIIAVFSAIMVTFSRNTVHSVLFLILDFVTVACLFIMIGAEFLGMIMLIVYVGAVAVLFLFVVMMLNVSLPKIKREVSKNFIFGAIISLVIFFEIIIAVLGKNYDHNLVNINNTNINDNVSNTLSLGKILYTDNIHLFQIAGMILLVAMIGAIVLTYQKRDGLKRQNVFNQISREKLTGVTLVDVENEKGIKLDD